jgi:hypothetical protein
LINNIKLSFNLKKISKEKIKFTNKKNTDYTVNIQPILNYLKTFETIKRSMDLKLISNEAIEYI